MTHDIFAGIEIVESPAQRECKRGVSGTHRRRSERELGRA